MSKRSTVTGLRTTTPDRCQRPPLPYRPPPRTGGRGAHPGRCYQERQEHHGQPAERLHRVAGRQQGCHAGRGWQGTPTRTLSES